MDLMAKCCDSCNKGKLVRGRGQCVYLNGWFGGKYPQAPPPKDWYTDSLGSPVCTARVENTEDVIMEIGRVPSEVPTPPQKLPKVRKQYFVLDGSTNKIFLIYAEEIKKFKGCNYTVNPLKNKVLEHFKETIFKI